MQRIWDLIDSSLVKLKSELSEERLDKLCAKLDDLASTGLPVAIGVILVTGLILAQKVDDSDPFNAALGAAVGAVFLGYLSYRCADGCRKAGTGDTSVLSLSLYLDVVIIIGTLGCLGGLLVGLAQIKDGNTEAAGMALSGGFAALIVAWTCANPSRLGVTVDGRVGATNDLLSLFQVFVRIVLRIVLPLSAVVVIVSTVLTLLAAIGALSAEGFELIKYSGGVAAGTSLILSGVGAPLAVYIAYVFISFPIGLYENIFAVKAIARNTAKAAPSAPAPSAPVQRSTDPSI